MTVTEPTPGAVEPVAGAVEPVAEPVVETAGPGDDWWDTLYDAPEAEAETSAAPETPAAGASVAGSVSSDPRLPYWWQKPQPQPEPQPQPQPQQRPEAGKTAKKAECPPHVRLLALRAEGGHGDVVARLCLDCDERLPARDPEPEPECEHERRLEARSPGGKLIGYVCADVACGARLEIDEVQGRLGKWLRAKSPKEYYPLPRNPFSPAPEGGEEAKPALSPGTRRLLANAAAAGAGYLIGLVPLIGFCIEECGRTTSIGGALFLGATISLVIGHFWDRRTRHWYPGLAWVARIPLASAITAIALYAPASQI